MPSRQDLLLEALKAVANTLAERFDVADVLYGLTDHAVQVLDANTAGVSLADGSGTLVYVSANSEIAGDLEMTQQAARQGPCHQAFDTGTTVAIDVISEHYEWPLYRAKAIEVGLGAVIGVPMAISGRRLGALNIYNREPRQWTAEDIDAATVLANMATSYILHASQLAEAQRLNEQLQHALDSRVVIEQAKGLVAGEMGISLEASFATLRSHARTHQASLQSVAEAVINLGLRPDPANHDGQTFVTTPRQPADGRLR